MPELPEVEVAARNLRRWAVGQTVARARADAKGARLFRPATVKAVIAALGGARLREVRRVGKNLLLTLDGRRGPLGVWSHLGMTGKWLVRAANQPAPGATRVELDLSGGTRLCYVDWRMFGRFRVVPGARFDDVPELATLGPDPLDDGIDAPALHARLQKLKLPIKVALLDQTLLAGVGNIQASESLFRAGIDPRRPARTLSLPEVRRLATGIRQSIAFTLKSFAKTGADGGDADIGYVEENRSENPFLVYGRAGQPCPRPGRHKKVASTDDAIVRFVQAGRSTFFCPRCQT